MQQKVLVFDVDGTLYDMVHHEIPSSAIASIKKQKKTVISLLLPVVVLFMD